MVLAVRSAVGCVSVWVHLEPKCQKKKIRWLSFFYFVLGARSQSTVQSNRKRYELKNNRHHALVCVFVFVCVYSILFINFISVNIQTRHPSYHSIGFSVSWEYSSLGRFSMHHILCTNLIGRDEQRMMIMWQFIYLHLFRIEFYLQWTMCMQKNISLFFLNANKLDEIMQTLYVNCHLWW